jgi:sugar lactone lactonase YvrE/enterochelin esterase-like enzyme
MANKLLKYIHLVLFSLIAGVVWLGSIPSNAQEKASGPPTIEPPGVVYEEALPPKSNNYPVGPDSEPQAGVPVGSKFSFQMTDSRIFPGTARTITVYVPAEYAADRPACVYVGLDGLGYGIPVVFDNLIAKHEIPVTIAIGVSSGTVSSAGPNENPRYDRSMEFDSRSDRLARFVIEEVLPEVERHQTPSGQAILLSKNPNDRAVGGGSTGGIGSFTIAWERPDAFRRVFISIGTFVGMRGGEQYYVLVRKTEPKPLRVFMQDGVYDEWFGGPEMGDWAMANRTMERALTYAGYDVKHVWGSGTHNGSQAAAIFPDVMRWLWRDWPAPVVSLPPGNPVLKAILQPGEEWQVAADGCAVNTSVAADAQGRVHYSTTDATWVAEVSATGAAIACRNSAGNAIAYGPDGRLYTALPDGGIRVISGSNSTVIGKGLHIHDITVRSNGDVYATAQAAHGEDGLWLISAAGKETLLDGSIVGASGVAFTPDGLWLMASQKLSHRGLSYRVQPNGTLDARDPYYDFYAPAWADDSGAAGIAMDHDGRAYVATRMGIQVFDRNGRVTAILPLPGNEQATSICFGDSGFDTLYVVARDKIYRRKMKVKGTPPWAAPIQLPSGAGA